MPAPAFQLRRASLPQFPRKRAAPDPAPTSTAASVTEQPVPPRQPQTETEAQTQVQTQARARARSLPHQRRAHRFSLDAPRAPARFASGLSFRAALAATAPSSGGRVVRPAATADTSSPAPLRFVATPTGGDCGFYAVAWGVAHALPARRRLRQMQIQSLQRKPNAGKFGDTACPAPESPTDVRVALARHVVAHAAEYRALRRAHGGSGSADGGSSSADASGGSGRGKPYVSGEDEEEDEDEDEDEDGDKDGSEAARAFAASVLRGGPTGHWLGERWGDVELAALARALALRLELYTFDVRAQAVRLYASFDGAEGDCDGHGDGGGDGHGDGGHGRTVALLFSGRADAGHFDLLRPQPSVWRRVRALFG